MQYIYLCLSVSAIGKTRRMNYYEENSLLQKEAALRIMQDDNALTLPQLKPLSEDFTESEFLMVLRDLHTNREYMHPEAVKSLSNWHCFFVDCPLMQGIDFTSSSASFPSNLSPPPEDSAVLVRTFCVQNRAFKLTVTRAPPSDEGRSVVFYALTASPLPVHYAVFESVCQTSEQRKACLGQYAGLSLLECKGVKVTASPVETPAELNVEQLSLEHGPQIFHGVGTKTYRVSGWFDMHEAERTSASCSLPLLLQHLCHLQYNLRGPVHYHIKAPNKYAYMVWLRNVAGLEIYMQVNMHASLAAMQNAFASSPPLSRRQPYHHNDGSSFMSSSLLQKTHFLESIQKQLNVLHASAADPSALDEDAFVEHMKYTGLNILLNEIVSETSHQKRLQDRQMARKVLEKLLPSPGLSGALSLDECLKAAYMACMGIAMDVWENLDAADKPTAFIHLLSKDLGNTHYYRIKDVALVPLLIRSCLDCNPFKWWERFLPLCELQGPKKGLEEDSHKSGYLCTSLLFHSAKYSRFFPAVFADASINWEKAVEDACIADSDLGKIKEAYETLVLAPSKDDENGQKLIYVRAVTYLMLLGKGDNLPRLKV